MGLGGFPSGHPLWVGMPGMHGTWTANMAFTECDLVIAIGARFDDRVTGKIDGFAPKAGIIHIDMDPAAIAKNVPVDIPVIGDARLVIDQLLNIVKPRKRNGWNERVEQWRVEHPVTYNENSGTLKPQYVIRQIHEATGGKIGRASCRERV